MFLVTLVETSSYMDSPELGGFAQVSVANLHDRILLQPLKEVILKNHRPFKGFKLGNLDIVLDHLKNLTDKNHVFPLGYHEVPEMKGLYLVILKG